MQIFEDVLTYDSATLMDTNLVQIVGINKVKLTTSSGHRVSQSSRYDAVKVRHSGVVQVEDI